MDREQKRFMAVVGAVVRRTRLSKNMTLEDMQTFGFSAQHFQKLECGKKNISFYTVYRIAKAWKMNLVAFTKLLIKEGL